MKLRVIISILFFISTILSAIHELEHIHEHDGSSCEVCIVKNNTLSADAVEPSTEITLSKSKFDLPDNLLSIFHIKNSTNQNRAPPSLS